MDDLVETPSAFKDDGRADTNSRHTIDAQAGMSSQQLALLYGSLPGTILANPACMRLIFFILCRYQRQLSCLHQPTPLLFLPVLNPFEQVTR